MLQNVIVCLVIFAVSLLMALPLGSYMNKVYRGRKNFLDCMKPVENQVYKICRINPLQLMDWKQYLVAMATINAIWLILAFVLLLLQGGLLLNPAGNPSMEWSLAMNSAVSFLTSTNLQHYSGESGATYLSQMGVFMFLQFVSAATSMSVGMAVVRGLAAKKRTSLGNYYRDFIRSITRILLPLSIVAAIIFSVNGVPMTFDGPQKIVTLQGDSVTIANGPVAAFLPIKELGSNGGGFFGANNAHPFENPGFFTYILHSALVFLLPMAFVFLVGYYLKSKRFSRMLFGVMTLGFLLCTVPIIQQEVRGNTGIAAMGVMPTGNMEGKEVRYGAFYSGFYAGENVVIPAGTIVGFHDSFMPLSGIFMLLGMNVDAFFGGVGTGWIYMFIFLIVSIFIGSLMIGRTPEIFGKKIGIEEMQITVSVVVLQNLVPFVLAGIACFTYTNYAGGNAGLQWLGNTGPHGFTTILYEYISAVAGNGSGFEALGDNTIFWNITTAIGMLTGRFIPIAGAVCIAGMLIKKTYTPRSTGTIRLQGVTYTFFLFIIIIILNVLSLFPALMLGPISDNLLTK